MAQKELGTHLEASASMLCTIGGAHTSLMRFFCSSCPSRNSESSSSSPAIARSWIFVRIRVRRGRALIQSGEGKHRVKPARVKPVKSYNSKTGQRVPQIHTRRRRRWTALRRLPSGAQPPRGTRHWLDRLPFCARYHPPPPPPPSRCRPPGA